jgi:glycosyltransferase involved in cell wall biosynthesis
MSTQGTTIDDVQNNTAQLLSQGKYLEAEQICMDCLQHNKLAPQLWVYLGEALLRQGYKYAAGQIFRRALLLDPQASWEEAVWRELDLLEDDEPRTDIEILVQVKKVTVSAALIVKDEERCIQRCIESIQHAVDEIIIVDTGSTDNTLELIGQYPHIRLFHYKWSNDFAAARNEVLKYVNTDWVYFIDADQYLHPNDVHAVREATGLLDDIAIPAAYMIGEIHSNLKADTADYTATRLFAMRHGIRYWGKVHEHVGGPNSLLSMPILIRPIRIRIYHDGYEPTVVETKQKMERNTKLLEQMLQDEPDNPAWWMFYGRQMFYVGNFDAAESSLIEAEKRASGIKLFGGILNIHMLLIKIYLAQNKMEQAEAVCNRALEQHPDFPDAHYWLGQIRLINVRQRMVQAQQHFIRAKQGFHTYRGTVTADHQIHEFKADRELAELTARMSWKG